MLCFYKSKVKWKYALSIVLITYHRARVTALTINPLWIGTTLVLLEVAKALNQHALGNMTSLSTNHVSLQWKSMWVHVEYRDSGIWVNMTQYSSACTLLNSSQFFIFTLPTLKDLCSAMKPVPTYYSFKSSFLISGCNTSSLHSTVQVPLVTLYSKQMTHGYGQWSVTDFKMTWRQWHTQKMRHTYSDDSSTTAAPAAIFLMRMCQEAQSEENGDGTPSVRWNGEQGLPAKQTQQLHISKFSWSVFHVFTPSSSNVPGSVSGQRDSVGSSMDLHHNWKICFLSFNVTDNWVIVLNGYLSCIFFLCFCCLFFKATKGKHDKLCYFCAVTCYILKIARL